MKTEPNNLPLTPLISETVWSIRVSTMYCKFKYNCSNMLIYVGLQSITKNVEIFTFLKEVSIDKAQLQLVKVIRALRTDYGRVFAYSSQTA